MAWVGARNMGRKGGDRRRENGIRGGWVMRGREDRRERREGREEGEDDDDR